MKNLDPNVVLTAVTAICAALPGLIAAIMGIINRNNISQLHFLINGRMGELLQITADASKAAGKLEAGLELASVAQTSAEASAAAARAVVHSGQPPPPTPPGVMGNPP